MRCDTDGLWTLEYGKQQKTFWTAMAKLLQSIAELKEMSLSLRDLHTCFIAPR